MWSPRHAPRLPPRADRRRWRSSCSSSACTFPAFLAIMATVVVYGIAADMTFQSVGKAFGLGFTAALEQVGPAGGGGRARAGAGAAPAARHRDIRPCRRAGRPRRLGGGRPRAAAAGGPGRAAAGAGARPHPACRQCPGGALAARRRRGLGDEGQQLDDAHGRAAACRDRGPAGLVVRGAPNPRDQRRRVGSTGRGSPSSSRSRC